MSVGISGNAIDPDGFTVSVRGQTHSLPAGDSLRLREVPPGVHTVRLGGVASHCVAESDSTRVTVEVHKITKARFTIECYGDLVTSEWYSPLNDQLFYLDEKGASRKLTAPMPGGQWSAKWSPDGTRVLFVQMQETEVDLYVVDLEGNTRPLAARKGHSEANAAWSPDGTWVVYVLTEGTGSHFFRTDLRLVRADGSEDRSLLNDGGIALAPVWSPDGRYIAFACWRAEHGICYIKPDGSGLARAPVSVRSPQHLTWSPDGSRIAFEGLIGGRQTIQILGVSEADLKTAISGPVSFGISHWSPDGRLLAVSVFENQEFGLHVVEAEGTNSRAVVSSGVRWSGNWSPDGAKLAFGVVPNAIHVTTPDGSHSRTLFTGNAMFVGTAWRPSTVGGAHSSARRLSNPKLAPLEMKVAPEEGAPKPACTARMRSGMHGITTAECITMEAP